MVPNQRKWAKSKYTPLIQIYCPHKNKTNTPESAKTKRLQIPQLVILYEELVNEDVGDYLHLVDASDGVSQLLQCLDLSTTRFIYNPTKKLQYEH